jgi:hypothetical protein
MVMRALAVLAAFSLATPALAQLPSSAYRPQDFELQQQQEQTRQQLIQQQNQLMAMEAQMRAQQAMQDIQAQKQLPRLTPPDVSKRPLPNIDVGALASIPDDVLAQSNRRVLDASQNRR